MNYLCPCGGGVAYGTRIELRQDGTDHPEATIGLCPSCLHYLTSNLEDLKAAIKEIVK